MTENRAETQAASPLQTLPIEYQVGTVGTLLALLVGAILKLRRRVSRDNTEVAKDRAETDLIKNLQTDREQAIREREQARESERGAWSEANRLAVVNAKLEQQVLYQQQEIDRLTKAVDDLQSALDEVKERLHHLQQGAHRDRSA